jgi:hypothetical protein
VWGEKKKKGELDATKQNKEKAFLVRSKGETKF